jgi:hypothetical protein
MEYRPDLENIEDALDRADVTWVREKPKDRRFKNGDDSAEDAWRCIETGEIRYCAVGQSPD